jgi:TetR/AcrR family transcriptional repressor of nem operon
MLIIHTSIRFNGNGLVTYFFRGRRQLGHSRADKAKTHERIVRLAAKRFREKGLDGIGIADLMNEAGLTVGGFYKHFGSRDELVAEAIASALGGWKRKVEVAAAGGPAVTFESLIDAYLSESHRDNRAGGCPVGSLAGEIARSGNRARMLVNQEVQESIKLLTNFLRKRYAAGDVKASWRAILTYSALVGAITLSRAVWDKRLSRDILKTVARLLKS